MEECIHDVLTSANRMSTFGFVASVSTRNVPAAAWQSIEMPATRNMARTDHIPPQREEMLQPQFPDLSQVKK